VAVCKLFVINDLGCDVLVTGTGKSPNVRTITDHSTDFSVNQAFFNGFYNGLQVGTGARNQYNKFDGVHGLYLLTLKKGLRGFV